MAFEWAQFVHEDPNEGMREIPAIRAAFAVVTEAVKALPKGQTIDPTWRPEIAELASVYHEEIGQLRREIERTPPPPQAGN